MTWSEAFAAYLESEGLTQTEVSYQLREPQSAIHYWMHGATPREDKRKRIDRWSKGRVPWQLQKAVAEPGSRPQLSRAERTKTRKAS